MGVFVAGTNVTFTKNPTTQEVTVDADGTGAGFATIQALIDWTDDAVEEGKQVTAAGFPFEALAPDDPDYDYESAGGVRFRSQSNMIDSILPTSGSTVDASAAVRKLLARFSEIDLGAMGLTYRWDSQLTAAETAGRTIKGVAKLLAAAGLPAGPMIELGADAMLRGGITVDGRSALQANSVVGVRQSGARSKVKDILIKDTKFYGLDIYHCDDVKAVRVRVEDTLDAGIIVREPTAAATMANVSLIGCDVDRSGVSGATIVNAGIKVAATNGATIKRLKISGCDVKMPVNPSSANGGICIEVWGGAEDVTTQGCTTHGGFMGVSYDVVTNGTITGCTARNFSLYGYEIAGSSRCTVTGNVADGEVLGTIGVSCSNSNLSNNVVSSNTIRRVTSRGITCNAGDGFVCTGNSIEVAGASSVGIYVLGGSSKYLVSSNRVTGDNSASTFGIVCESSSEGSVENNRIRGFITAGVKASGAYVFTDLVVSHNHMKNVNSVHFTKDGGGTISTGCAVYDNWVDGTLADIRGNSASGYTLNQWDRIAQFGPASGITATLPAAVTKGQWHQIRLRSGAGTVSVVPTSGTINGKASIPLLRIGDEIKVVYNGNEWVTEGGLPDYWAAISTSTDGSGDVTVTHGLGLTPSAVLVTVTGTTFAVAQVHTVGSTTFKVRFFDAAGVAIASTAVTANWQAIL